MTPVNHPLWFPLRYLSGDVVQFLGPTQSWKPWHWSCQPNYVWALTIMQAPEIRDLQVRKELRVLNLEGR